jgi:hypothetical protein
MASLSSGTLDSADSTGSNIWAQRIAFEKVCALWIFHFKKGY